MIRSKTGVGGLLLERIKIDSWLVAETRVSSPGGGPARVWLRTAYRR